MKDQQRNKWWCNAYPIKSLYCTERHNCPLLVLFNTLGRDHPAVQHNALSTSSSHPTHPRLMRRTFSASLTIKEYSRRRKRFGLRPAIRARRPSCSHVPANPPPWPRHSLSRSFPPRARTRVLAARFTILYPSPGFPRPAYQPSCGRAEVVRIRSGQRRRAASAAARTHRGCRGAWTHGRFAARAPSLFG